MTVSVCELRLVPALGLLGRGSVDPGLVGTLHPAVAPVTLPVTHCRAGSGAVWVLCEHGLI